MKVSIIKLLDQIIGPLLVSLIWKGSARGENPEALGRILLIRPGGIGDAVHLLSLIRLLKIRFPDAAIDILAERRNALIFDLSPDVRTVLRYDVTSEFIATVRSSYDVVIDSEQWHRLSAVVARLVRAPVRIGFGTNKRSRLFTFPISYSHDDNEIESFYRLLTPLGIDSPAEVREPWIQIPDPVDKAMEHALECLEGRFVVIFPGASISERRWGGDRFREVALSLLSKGLGIVVVGGREDCTTGDRICADGVGINLAGKTTLAETAAIIDRSALLISGDSGILHIGVALGKPTVSLFGPGIAAKWAPRGEGHIVLNRNLPCSPCTKFGTTPPCPHGVRCMSEITASDVVAAVERLLSPESRYSPK